MSASTVGECLSLLDSWYPPGWAESWDNPGLQAGDPRGEVSKILLALDPTIEVIREAADQGAELLVTHHPLIFGTGVLSVDASNAWGEALSTAIKSGVSIIACHTNADVAIGGVSDVLAGRLGLAVSGPLEPTGAGGRAKLVTFVPTTKTHEVIEILAKHGAGTIGEYEVCSFRVAGVGTFRPSHAAKPRRGKKLVVNEEDEDRVEMVVPTERLAGVIEALIEAHPYEEVAYDVYELSGPTGLGLGRVGELKDQTTAGDFALWCDEALGSVGRFAGDPRRSVRRVALCGGSGASLREQAARAGADVFVTADVKHHEALDAIASGLAVIDAGHFATEWPWVEHLAELLRAESLGADIGVSRIRTDPFGVVS